jgi:hypothetical protein
VFGIAIRLIQKPAGPKIGLSVVEGLSIGQEPLSMLRPERPIVRVGLLPELLQCFEHCHSLAQRRSAESQAMLSTLGLHLLSILQAAHRLRRNVRRPIDEKIQEAQLIIARRFTKRSSWRSWLANCTSATLIFAKYSRLELA